MWKFSFLFIFILSQIFSLKAEQTNTTTVAISGSAQTAPGTASSVANLSNPPGMLAAEEKESREDERLKNMPLEERLNQPISLDLRNMDVLDALKYLSEKANMNIVATKNVSGRVTITLENVAIRDIFDLILRSNGLAYIKRKDVYQVMTEAEYKTFYGKNFFDLRQVKVIRLKYAIPEQAFSLLDALKTEVGRVLVDKESGSVLLMDTPEQISQMESALAEFERSNIVEVFTLQHARAKEVEDILKARLDAKNVGSIKSDERNNQVIVQALSERMEEIRGLIVSLDKPTKEVLIDIKIIKIKLSDKLESGIEWEGIFNISEKLGTTYLGSTPFIRSTAGITNPTFTTRRDAYNNLGGQIASYPFSGTTSSLSASTKVTAGERLHFGFFDSDRDFDTLLKYLNTLGSTRVLANPKLAVVNNQEAKIHIGERQAYVTSTTTQGQTTSTIAEEVQFVDVGIQLSVTPRINDDGVIVMKIRPEISSVGATLVTPTNNRIPIIDTSLTETTVMISDNTTLLIGGLRREDKTSDSEGVPGLSKIPLLGKFFKSSSDTTLRTEILVMITPHIISGNEFRTGYEKTFKTAPGKEYQEYPPLTSDKTVIPEGISSTIQPKTYRDYLSLGDSEEATPLLEEPRLETN